MSDFQRLIRIAVPEQTPPADGADGNVLASYPVFDFPVAALGSEGTQDDSLGRSRLAKNRSYFPNRDRYFAGASARATTSAGREDLIMSRIR